ncbi:3-ketoacyl-CoA reductase [Apiospora saccharicola]
MANMNDILSAVPQSLLLGFAGIGALYLGSHALGYLQFLLNVFVLSGTNLRKYGKKGTWAVVTGASDGLGKEFASQLAAKGFNLVLVSRTQSKLEDLSKELEHKFTHIQTKILAMDFSADNDSDYERLAELVQDLDIAILINNVGQSHSIPTPFVLTEKKELQDIITINCMGTLKVTKIVAPGMQQRKRGLILTMGSFGGWAPSPPTRYLLRIQGLPPAVLCLSYLVTTAMSKVRRTSMLIPSARTFVRSALGKVGTGGWQSMPDTYTPFWSHALMAWAAETFLGTGSKILRSSTLKMHVDIRNRALKKAARESKKQ